MRGSALLDQSIHARRNGGRDILVLVEGPGLVGGLSFAVVRERNRVSVCGRLRTCDAGTSWAWWILVGSAFLAAYP